MYFRLCVHFFKRPLSVAEEEELEKLLEIGDEAADDEAGGDKAAKADTSADSGQHDGKQAPTVIRRGGPGKKQHRLGIFSSVSNSV